MQAIDEALITPDNIDPNDPEEKARLKYLRENMNVYEHIFDINSRKYSCLCVYLFWTLYNA